MVLTGSLTAATVPPKSRDFHTVSATFMALVKSSFKLKPDTATRTSLGNILRHLELTRLEQQQFFRGTLSLQMSFTNFLAAWEGVMPLVMTMARAVQLQ